MNSLKSFKEVLFLMFILVVGSTMCQSQFELKVVQIKNRNSNKCLKRTSLRQSRIVQSPCNPHDPSSLWFIRNVGGSYKIMSYQTDLVFDVRDNSNQNLAAIQLYTYVQGNNQKWYINHKGGEFYEFKAVSSNKCVDVSYSKTENLVGILQYDCHGGNNQQFSFHPINSLIPNKFKQGATYRIKSYRSNKCLQYTGYANDLVQNDCTWDNNRKFKVLQNNDGSYSIKPVENLNHAIDISGFGTNNGSRIFFWEFNRFMNQKLFFISAMDEDKFYIRDVNSGKCYDVPSGTSNYSRIQLWECQNNNPNQYWIFEELEYIPDFAPDTNRFYRIKSNKSNLCLTNNRRKATPLTRSTCNNNDNSQLWKFNNMGDGYTITSFLEAKSIDVLEGSIENGGILGLWETHNGVNQRWLLPSRNWNVFAIQSLHSRKCFQFPGENSESLVFLGQFDCWDFPSQEFTFEIKDPVEFLKPDKAYRIINKGNGKCYRYNGNYKDITQGPCDGSDATKFAFTKSNADASYYINPYFNMNQVIDVKGFGTNNGSTLHAWDINFTWNQKFFIFGYDENTFYIRDGNSEKCIDVPGGSRNDGIAMQIWDCMTGNLNQSFSIVEFPQILSEYFNLNGYMQIMNVRSNKCLSFNFPLNANQVPCNINDESTFWKFEYFSEDNSYFIVNKINNKYLDVSGGRTNNNNGVIGWDKHGGPNQRFKIEFEGSSITSNTNLLFRGIHSNRCLKIVNDSYNSFENLVIFDCDKNADSQKFRLIGVVASDIPVNNKFYSLKSVSSNQCLKYNGINANTTEFTCDQNNSTRFKFVSSIFGSYRILSTQNNSNHALNSYGQEGFNINAVSSGEDDYQRFFVTSYNADYVIIRHYQSGRCLSNENGVFYVRNCNTNDNRQAFKISVALDEWENIYENGESC